jgi:hypothetical protein
MAATGEKPMAVDRSVHDLLQTLSSVYNAGRLAVIEPQQASYLAELFFDWLRVAKAQAVWEQIFKEQEDTWPEGFTKWVDDGLSRRRTTAP